MATTPVGGDWGTVVGELLALATPPPLDAGVVVVELAARLENLQPADLFPSQRITDADAARACLAGLWLWANDLDASHTISQALDTYEGSYWHAIMHRREGDFGNAKYWLRRAGDLPRQAAAALGGGWDAAAFVDRCQRATRGDSACQQQQTAEWRWLFQHCYQAAT